MTDSLIVPCAQCASLNCIPAARVHDAPHCGRCKSEALPDQPFELQQSQFANQIKGDLPLLVDVWASQCRRFALTFAQAARQLQAAAAWPSSTAKPMPSCRHSSESAPFPA